MKSAPHPSLSCVLAKGDESFGLQLSPNGLCWTGRLDDASEAPLVTFRADNREPAGGSLLAAARAGDAEALSAVVERLPLPPGLLVALAARCVELGQSGETLLARPFHGDPRWRRALARAVAARTEAPAAQILSSPRAVPSLLWRTRSTLEIDDVHVYDDKCFIALDRAPGEVAVTCVRISDGAVVWRHPFACLADERVSLLPPLPGDISSRPASVIIGFGNEHAGWLRVRVLDEHGVVRQGADCLTGFRPEAASVSGRTLFAQAGRDILVIDLEPIDIHLPVAPVTAQPPCLAALRGDWPPHLMDGALAFAGPHPEQPRESGWFWLQDKGTGQPPGAPEGSRQLPCATLPGSPGRLCAAGDAVYMIASGAGLLRARPGEPPVMVMPGKFLPGALAVSCGIIAAGAEGGGIAALNIQRTEVVWQLAPGLLGGPVSALIGLEKGFIAAASQRIWHIALDGAIQEVAPIGDAGGILRAHQFPNGPSVIAAGGDKACVIAPDGSLLNVFIARHITSLGGNRKFAFLGMADDGRSNLFERGLVIGPSGAMLAAIEEPPPGLYLFEQAWRAGATERDIGGFFGEGVLVARGNEVLALRPAYATSRTAPCPLPGPRRKLMRVTQKGATIYSPRDDTPEPGLRVDNEDLVAVDCRFEGSSGAVRCEDDLILDAGAVVTLIHCQLSRVRVACGATLAIVGEVPTIIAEAGAHVLQITG